MNIFKSISGLVAATAILTSASYAVAATAYYSAPDPTGVSDFVSFSHPVAGDWIAIDCDPTLSSCAFEELRPVSSSQSSVLSSYGISTANGFQVTGCVTKRSGGYRCEAFDLAGHIVADCRPGLSAPNACSLIDLDLDLTIAIGDGVTEQKYCCTSCPSGIGCTGCTPTNDWGSCLNKLGICEAEGPFFCDP